MGGEADSVSGLVTTEVQDFGDGNLADEESSGSDQVPGHAVPGEGVDQVTICLDGDGRTGRPR